MREIVEEILDRIDDDKRSNIMEDLGNWLSSFYFRMDQASELFDLGEKFLDRLEDWDDRKLRAWLILAYEDAHAGWIPSSSAVDDAVRALRAYERYGDEFYEWKRAKKLKR